jgi:hypothetical protein
LHLLLAAGVQAVKVTNWPTPSPLPKPEWTYNIGIHHVDVGWATFWVAAFALLVAIIAALYAKGAFKAAEDDLDISKRNWEMVNRAPKLTVKFDVPAPLGGSVGCPRGAHYNYNNPQLIATVWNTDEGKRRCDAFFIEVIVPVEAFSLPEQARLAAEPHYGFVTKSQVVQEMLYPGGGATAVAFEFPFNYAARAGSFTLQYRMKDDYNDYPPEKSTLTGYLSVEVQLPIRPQHAFVNPRDAAEMKLHKLLSSGHPNDDDSAWHGQYTHAFELLDAGGFKTPDERMKAATDIAILVRGQLA